MRLPQDQLDDWNFNQLVAEGVSMVPSVAPEWTNFNASDPGMTLLELFAYLTEMLVFQTGQTTTADRAAFLRLLTAQKPDSSVSAPVEGEVLDLAIRDAMVAIRRPERAVTCADYETLAVRADARIARAKCVPARHLGERSEAARKAVRPGHVSVVLITAHHLAERESAVAISRVVEYLEPRRLITTRVHVVLARPVDFEVTLRVVAKRGVAPQAAVDLTRNTLQTFFDPERGGLSGSGWPVGRDVYLSELYLVVSRLHLVEHIIVNNESQSCENSILSHDPNRLNRNAAGGLIGLRIAPDEIPGNVSFAITAATALEDISREV